MKVRIALGLGWVLMATVLYGQTAPSWPCSSDLTKSEGDNRRIRISTGVSEGLAEKKILPDVADLKGAKVDSTVIIRVLVDKNGVVRCADPVSGDASLFQRSTEAAQQWRFKPFLLNGQPLIFESQIEFVFKKNKVKAS
ncbi:MAG TPA: energy transducer TonB [Terriglobales bacterium]|nr:energy transducer TonB [Terriglobales bacterium]